MRSAPETCIGLSLGSTAADAKSSGYNVKVYAADMSSGCSTSLDIA